MMAQTMNYITKGIGGFYYVRTAQGIVECKARGIFRKRGITPVAGDLVELSPDGTMIDHTQMLRTRQYKLCAVAVALSAPPVLLFSPEIFSIATERGLPESAAPFSIVLGSAASAAGRLLCPAGSDRLGRKRVLYGVYLGLAAGSVAFAFAREWWVLAAYATLTFFYSGGAAVQPAFNSDLFGLRHAGVNYGFLALGMSGGSLLSYLGSQALPLEARHGLAVGCALVGLVCVRLVKPLPQS